MRTEPLSLEAAAAAAAAIGACVQTMLGPTVTLKMVAEEDGSGELTSDVLALVGALNVRHPVGAIIEELCGAQAEEVGNGLTTLVALSGALALAARDLVRLGLRIDAVLLGFDECVSICTDTLARVRVPSGALLEWDERDKASPGQGVSNMPAQLPAAASALTEDERELGALAAELAQLERAFALPSAGAELDWFFEEGPDEAPEPCGLRLPQPSQPQPQPQRSTRERSPEPAAADVSSAIASSGHRERAQGALEAAGGADERELELLATSLAHGREREMALAAAAARAVGLASARAAHGGAAGRRCAADELLARVHVSRLVGRLGEQSRVLPATVVLELERADAERLSSALAGEGPSRAAPPLLAVCVDGDGGFCRFAPHHASAAAQPGATRRVVSGVGDFGARAAAADDAEDAYARGFVCALERACAEQTARADGARARALVAVRGSASAELEERLRAAGHLLVAHLSGRELRQLAALAGGRLSPPTADAREAAAWLGAEGARPARLLHAAIWREGWTPELEAKMLRAHAESARAGHESSWRLALSARPCDAVSAGVAPARDGGPRAAWPTSASPAAQPLLSAGLPCAVLLCAPSEPAAQDAERAFRRCLSRLRNAMLARADAPLGASVGALLPGGGACDVACMCALRDRARRAREEAMAASSGEVARARLLELAEVVAAFARALESTLACALVNCGLAPVAAIDLCADAMARWTACSAGAAAGAHDGHLRLLETYVECAPVCEAARRLALPAQRRLAVPVCDDPISRVASFENAVSAVRLVLLSDAVVTAASFAD